MNPIAYAREARLRERCEILAAILRQVSPIYQDPITSPDQKRFIETIIGASLWYLPVIDECWTGKISVEALLSLLEYDRERVTLTADHEYPRKIAAADLLSKRISNKVDLAKHIYEMYKNKYGKYSYITPRENKRLMPFQRKGIFKNPMDAYNKAGIQLVTITKEELRIVKRYRDERLIKKLLKNAT